MLFARQHGSVYDPISLSIRTAVVVATSAAIGSVVALRDLHVAIMVIDRIRYCVESVRILRSHLNMGQVNEFEWLQ